MFQIRRACHFWLWAFVVLLSSAPVAGQEATPPRIVPAQSFSGAYLAGRIASAHNDVPAAIDYFRQALAFDPGNQQLEEELLLLLLANNAFDEAVALASTLKDKLNSERAIYLTLAADAFRKQNFDQIETLLVMEEPDLVDELMSELMWAWSLFGKGDAPAAIQVLETMAGPVWYDLFRSYHLALIYQLVGDETKAQAAFEQALEAQLGGASSPDNYERIVAAYAVHLQAMGKEQEAIQLLQKGSSDLVGRTVLDALRVSASHGERLPPLVTNAHEGAAEVLYSLGTVINRSGSEFYARLYLNIALGLRPDHDATLFQLAELGARMGRPQDSIALYRRLEADSPYFRDGQWRLGVILSDLGRRQEAIELLQTLLEAHEGDEGLLIALASIHMQDKNFADVVTLLDTHFKREDVAPENASSQGWRLFFQRGIAHERLQQWSQAEADFRHALVLFPEQPQVLNYLGYSLIDQDMKLEEALEMVRRAAELRPRDGAIIDSLGWAYYKIGRYDEAIEALEEAVRLRPEDPTINDHLGDAYWQVGRKFEAVFQWKHALAGNPEEQDLAKIEAKLKQGSLPENSASSQ